jgi:hypothetical protein
MFQDDTEKNPDSLICDFGQIKAAMVAALGGKQLQPLWCVDI